MFFFCWIFSRISLKSSRCSFIIKNCPVCGTHETRIISKKRKQLLVYAMWIRKIVIVYQVREWESGIGRERLGGGGDWLSEKSKCTLHPSWILLKTVQRTQQTTIVFHLVLSECVVGWLDGRIFRCIYYECVYVCTVYAHLGLGNARNNIYYEYWIAMSFVDYTFTLDSKVIFVVTTTKICCRCCCSYFVAHCICKIVAAGTVEFALAFPNVHKYTYYT